MAERYGVLLPSYWDGPTGKQIQAKGGEAVILGAYLGSNKYANMIGLYELPLLYVLHDLPVLRTRAAVLRAFRHLSAVEYAYYDEATEFVWVREMARIRLHLRPGERLSTASGHRDKRQPAVVELYESLKPNPFLARFHDRYAADLGLPRRREGHQRGINGASEPSQGASKPDGRGTDAPAKPVISDQRSGTSDQRSGTGNSDQVPVISQQDEKAAAAPRRARADEKPDDPEANVEVITALVTKELLPLGLDDGDLVEATKERCSKRHIAYNGSAVRKAVDSAVHRARLGGRP